MPFSIVMNGMGIVALAGIVVRNGILLVEFTDVLIERGMKTREAIIQGWKKPRITPVLAHSNSYYFGLVLWCIRVLNIRLCRIIYALSTPYSPGQCTVAIL